MTYGERVIAISEHIKSISSAIIKFPKAKSGWFTAVWMSTSLIRIPFRRNGLLKQIKAFNIPEDKPVLLLLGRLTNWKGQHLLIEALSMLGKHKDYYCLIVGPDQGRVKYSGIPA